MRTHYRTSISMIEDIIEDATFYMFTDYSNGGALSSIGRCLSEKEIRLVITRLLDGLQILHQKRIIHRDLNQSNVLLHFPELEQSDDLAMIEAKRAEFTQDLSKCKFYVKIADFGVSRIPQNNEVLDARATG